MSKITAWLSVVFIALTVLLPVVRWIHRFAIQRQWKKIITVTTYINIILGKYHRDIAYLVVFFGWIHSLWEFIQRGMFFSGVLIWAALIFLVWSGVQKNFRKDWLASHRIVTAALVVLTFMHLNHPGFYRHFSG